MRKNLSSKTAGSGVSTQTLYYFVREKPQQGEGSNDCSGRRRRQRFPAKECALEWEEWLQNGCVLEMMTPEEKIVTDSGGGKGKQMRNDVLAVNVLR